MRQVNARPIYHNFPMCGRYRLSNFSAAAAFQGIEAAVTRGETEMRIRVSLRFGQDYQVLCAKKCDLRSKRWEKAMRRRLLHSADWSVMFKTNQVGLYQKVAAVDFL